MDNTKYISVLVENHEGVLAKLSSLFCQRGFNIDSLSVSATNDNSVSRITIITKGDDHQIDQIMKQTAKLQEFRGFFDIDSDSIARELLLIKMKADDSNRSVLREISEIYKAKIIDLSTESMIFELTGEPAKINAFLEMLERFEILEMCRTGVTAIKRGKVCFKGKDQ